MPHEKKEKKEQIVLVTGTFNILHPGHLRFLRFAKECGDTLIVGVNSDRIAGRDAHVPADLRLDGIRSNSWVDEAFVLDESVGDVISRLRPDVVVKGKEHEQRFNPELGVLEEFGGRLLFSSGEIVYSSVDLLRKEFYEAAPRALNWPDDYMARRGIERAGLGALLESFAGMRVCVVGDLVLDEYITCQALGMSQEDPTIVVTPIDSFRFVGGAGIVAAHGVGLGASVQFLSVTGADDARLFVQKELGRAGVHGHLLVDDSRPTTLKQRYRSKDKTLLRVSHLHQGAISSQLQAHLLEELATLMDNTDLLVCSDFNYGCLPQALVERAVAMAKTRGVLLAADSQSSSQTGDIGRFSGMDLITPTEREARISTRNQEDGLVVLAEQLRQRSGARNILLKLGEEGLLIHAGDHESSEGTDRVGAMNSSPKDVAGAGDSLLMASALTLARGGTIWEAAVLGSLAAAVQVSRVGNTPLRAKELFQELRK